MLRTHIRWLVRAPLLVGGGCLRWWSYPVDQDGEGGVEVPVQEMPAPAPPEEDSGPVLLRREAGTVRFRPAGTRAIEQLAFYAPRANIGPGAYVLLGSGSRAELKYPDGTLVVLHNRTTARLEDSDRDGSHLYVSYLNRLTAEIPLAARIRLPGGTLVRLAPPLARAEAPEGQAGAPEEAPAEKPAGAISLADLFAGRAGQKPSPGAPVAGAGEERPRAVRGAFVATDFRQGRYVRLHNRCTQNLLVSHVGGECILAPGEAADFPVLRGVKAEDLPDPLVDHQFEDYQGLRVRLEGPGTVIRDGVETVRAQAAGEDVRVWAAGALLRLGNGEICEFRPLPTTRRR